MPGVQNCLDRLNTSGLNENGERIVYSYASPPSTLVTRKFKYRNEANDAKYTSSYGNVMHDRRVVRGTAIASHPVPTAAGQSAAARMAEARRRLMARKKAQMQASKAIRLRLGTPPPVAGRKHEDVQTDAYLEELFEHPKEETVAVQTEPFVDRPPTPKYIPAKTGIDVMTQIYPGDLFDFDVEVEPILEVLVGKTVEQALVEVLEEDELESIKEQQRRYRELRAAEKAEEERLEEEERRRTAQKERRIAEHIDATRLQKETEERVAAAVLTSGYIADLLPNVLEGLKQAGYLVDDIKEDIDCDFMVWLMDEVKVEMQRMVENRDLLSEIVREILENMPALGCQKRVCKADLNYCRFPLPNPLDDEEEGEEESTEGGMAITEAMK